jgi:hypothetical protein
MRVNHQTRHLRANHMASCETWMTWNGEEIGKAVDNGSPCGPKNNKTALTAHLKQRPACLKLRVRGIASLMIAVMHSNVGMHICTSKHIVNWRCPMQEQNSRLIYQPRNGHADIGYRAALNHKKNPTTRPNNQIPQSMTRTQIKSPKIPRPRPRALAHPPPKQPDKRDQGRR